MGERRVANLGRDAHDALQLGDGVAVDLGDGGAGDDVVELVEQDRLPGRLQLVMRIGEAGEDGDGREGLRLQEPVLGGAVELLHVGLRGQGAPVELQIELAHPDRQALFWQRREKLLDVRHAQPRQRRELLEPRVVFQHAGRRAASAVAPAEGEQALRVEPLAAEVAPGAERVEWGDVAVVAVRRRQVAEHVGRHPAAVDPLPGEEVVGEEILLAPVELDGEEAGQPGPAQELRDAAGEAEDVGEPGDGRALAEPALEGALAVEELAHERFAAGDLAVRLNPGAADRLPPPLRDPLLDPGEEVWRVLLDPGVELRRRLVEGEIGVALHQVEDGGKGAPPFPPRLGHRPEPGQIEVRVAGQGQSSHRRVIAPEPRQSLGDLGTGLPHRLAGTLREWLQLPWRRRQMPDRHREWMNVERFEAIAGRYRLDPAADGVDIAEGQPRLCHVGRRGPGRAVDGEGRLDDLQQVRHDLVIAQLLRGEGDHGEVPLQGPHVMLRHDEVGPLQPRLGDVAAEHPLRHHLRRDRDLLSTLRSPSDAKAVVEGVESALKAVGQAQEPLAAEPELQLDWLPGPRLRHPTRGGKVHRRLDERPVILDRQLSRCIPGREGPCRNRDLARIAPGAQLLQPPRNPLLPPLIEPGEHA